MARVPESFLGTLFALSADPEIISFAGGLPSTALIDVAGIKRAAHEVLEGEGAPALQYTTTDGYLPLRHYIAERYRHRLHIAATADEIQIVNGSQQCLDLVAKILVNPGNCISTESPGYLGAFEAFSLYEPILVPVPLLSDGPDISAFTAAVDSHKPRFFYAIPNSQNPSGCTYSDAKRREIAAILAREDVCTLFYEDDAFGELFFDNRPRAPVKKYLPDRTVMSGSFSKTVAPGLRTGWIFAPPEILKQFNIAKQAADLHSNLLSQMVLHRYLITHDYDAHLSRVTAAYGANCRLMCDCLDDMFPPEVSHTLPEGGMFLTVTLPQGMDSMEIFTAGIAAKVAIMPGAPFFSGRNGRDTFRLNFSNTDAEKIKEGMGRLSCVIRKRG